MEKIISIILSVAVTATTLVIFNKKYSKNESVYISHKSKDTLRGEFQRKDLLLLSLFFISIPIIAYISYKVFILLLDLRFSGLQNNGILISPDKGIWLVLALFVGMALAFFIFNVIQKPLFKEKYNDYIYYSSLKYRFDFSKVSVLLINFLLIGITIFFILQINNFTHFGNDKVTISRFLQLSDSEYLYEDITAIKSIEKSVAANGKIVEKTHFIIAFSDNSKWDSSVNGYANYKMNIPVIDFVLSKTDLELKYLEFNK